MNTSVQISSGVYMPTIIVFCHLRWDFVYQRPQHLLCQLAQHFEIIVVEEPFYYEGKSFLKTYTPAPNITVCQPHTPVRASGFHDDQLAELEPLVAGLVRDGENPIVWFYTPMALPLLKQLHAKMVVYDCMDELSAVQNAPKQLLQREKALLGIADIVFTGGPSLYEAKLHLHPNVHCFPSSVDAVHFEQALDRSNGHPLQAALLGPKLGFYGVIDERLDLNLIAALADVHLEWQIIIVGPVVKINPDSLPKRDNIHYFGQQPYQALPQFLAEWDVCLLPFALNESTRSISPTEVLEYMAAELPIVSTAINDVVAPYNDIVAIGYDISEFIAACETALAYSAPQKKRMAEKMRDIVATTSWERTGDAMFQLIRSLAQLDKTSRLLATAPVLTKSTVRAQIPANINAIRPTATMQSVSCAIIGAGPTGLSAAYHLGAGTLLLERNATVGGWCRSIKDNGFTFDDAGHINFSNDPYVLELYDILLGDNQHWQNREVCHESAISQKIIAALGATPKTEDCCTDDSSVGANDSMISGNGRSSNFEQFIDGALPPVAKSMAPNARFGYPKQGGFQALVSAFVPHIKGQIELNADVLQLLPSEHLIVLADGRRFLYDNLISTMPLPELVRLIGNEAPKKVQEAAHALRHISLRCVNIGINREKVTDKHWIYYPEDTMFHRIFLQGNASPQCNAPGGFGFTCEIYYSPWQPLPLDGDDLIARCIEDCIKVGFMTADDEVLTANLVDMPYAYVIYDHARANNVAVIKAWMESKDISLAGRNSEWEYCNSDHAFLAGKQAANYVLQQINSLATTALPTLSERGS
jgi:protoporphyrinogen oxidase/glycosyltransferase involved in cell wall biosynthesis